MRVADEDEPRVRLREVRLGAILVEDVVELRRIEDIAVRRDRLVYGAGVGERLQPRDILFGERGAMALDGFLREIDERRGVAAPRNRVVVVAGEDDEALPAHKRDGLGRERAVSDYVAEADDLLRAVGARIREDALKRRHVRMDIGDYRVFHVRAPSASPMPLSPEAGG